MKSVRASFYQAVSGALATLVKTDMLPWAAGEGRADTVRLLLAIGGDNVYGYTKDRRGEGSFRRIDQALWQAASRGHTAVVALLTKAAEAPDGYACRHGLYLAETGHHDETAKVLKERVVCEERKLLKCSRPGLVEVG